MKKVICLCVAALLLLSLVACNQTPAGTSQSKQPSQPQTTAPTVPTTVPTMATKPTTIPTTPETKPTQPKNPAPDFTVYGADGNPVKLSDFLGKPVVLNFWASWCPPCKAELPDFQAEFDAQGESVHFLFINLTDGKNETQDSATSFINSMGYTFPVYFDLDGDAVNAYGIRSIPTTYFIDAEGNLVAKAVGSINIAALRQYIRMIAPET